MDSSIPDIYSLRENIKKELYGLYSGREIDAMVRILFTHRLGIRGHEIGLYRQKRLSKTDAEWFSGAIERIRQFYPLQYITGSTEFFGIPLKISQGVLIPRPETEELAEWIIRENRLENPGILDIGTGSGCIALALKKHIPGSKVMGTDISPASLAVATENAISLQLDVLFHKHDIFSEETISWLDWMDIIVSNPPYIPESHKSGMEKNVIGYEPHSSLFVPDNDPLVFYRRIASFGMRHLNAGGHLFFEIHEQSGRQVMELMEQKGFREITIRHDINGKSRMLKCIKG